MQGSVERTIAILVLQINVVRSICLKLLCQRLENGLYSNNSHHFNLRQIYNTLIINLLMTFNLTTLKQLQ